MSGETPALTMNRRIEDGTRHITLTCIPSVYSAILEDAGVSAPEDMSDDYLRGLCHAANYYNSLEGLRLVEEMTPGGVVLQLEPDIEIYTSDIGVDLARRLMGPEDPEHVRLCDPQYNPVVFELRVVDSATCETTAAEVGQCVLAVTLHPPDLAR